MEPGMTVIVAIDQGTTSTRAIVYRFAGGIPAELASAQIELPQHYPQDGWVEHDANQIWEHTQKAIKDALAKAEIPAAQVRAIGITNQRETTVLWDRKTGLPVYNAIVWQDRRTAASCNALKKNDTESWLQEKTGLLADPYFSATKLFWLIEKGQGIRARAEAGELAFGTIDSWLIYKLTGGKVHATDATNASRTMLFNIHTQEWDAELLAYFTIPPSVLPQVHDSAADYGLTDPALFGAAIPIRGVAGDQQAAAVGQMCLEPGSLKSTYGTGCFVLLNTGIHALASQNRLLTTVALRVNGQTTYALEGSIFVAGAAIQWLRDGLHAITASKEVEALAASVPDSGGVIMVPAFTGLGAPYWDAQARGAIFGLTRDTGLGHIARATLESMAFQSMDLIDCLNKDLADSGGQPIQTIKVDGGMSRNDGLMQQLSDITGIQVQRPALTETTALGAAYLALLGGGFVPSLESLKTGWQCAKSFVPQPSHLPGRWQNNWKDAINRVKSQS
jgi:glycerol kinase